MWKNVAKLVDEWPTLCQPCGSKKYIARRALGRCAGRSNMVEKRVTASSLKLPENTNFLNTEQHSF